MTRYKKFIRFVCYLFIFTILCSCGPKTPEEIQRDYHTFLDRLFTSYVSQDSLTLHYTLSNPENYGITNSTPSLGKYTVKQMKKDLSAAENYKKKLESFPYEILSREDKITYDILYDSLTKTIQFGDYLYFSQVLGPTTGFQAQLPILLAEYTLKDKQDIEQYLTLLSKVKEYFQMICKFEEEKAQRGYFMSDTTAEQIILQCSSYIKSPENNFLITEFERRLKTLDFLTEKECAAYIQKNHELVTSNIIPSYQLIVTTLSNLKGSSPNKNGLCDYENGKNYYELKVQQITGSNKSIPEMKAMLTKALNYNLAQMTSLCIKDPTLTSAYNTLTFPYTDPEEKIGRAHV